MVFVALAGVVALAGIALGLALAPRLTAWDDRRARPDEPDSADTGYDPGGEAGSTPARGEGEDGGDRRG
jgi:hypothetical protein